MKNISFVIISLAFVSCSTDEKNITGLCLISNAPLTSEPSQDSEILDFVEIGDTLEVWEQEDDHLFVRRTNGKGGWIERRLVLSDGLACSFISPASTYLSAGEEHILTEAFYPLDYANLISSDNSGWSEVVGVPATKDTLLRAWVRSENLSTAHREVSFAVGYRRAMALTDSAKREARLLKLYSDPYLKDSKLLFEATYEVIHADEEATNPN